mmetsp:Transcript_37856/g.89587  ORF Transcript_37856/g.89587 Transcript_37856/m.89587 type:complete len:342 (-) Transcript_37856:66-1091(-)|eukprot:CAMPEP_0177701540 /NCGR_PEP_ID=MMETSP0484_2-20121128/6664_1 /TAXON_ID=354590 /ORGANISM="Rhodomonas lens, Strain RHODO" /LENGTH=341 /DNA_ID=CAMNT_0019212777 /DNA_START=106 /DNA_END=1131 /DNA_ORIENTATION=+
MRFLEIAAAIGAVLGVGAVLKMAMGRGRKARRKAVAMCGKVAVVTGGTSGIGLETCERLVCSGVRVFLACRDVKRAQKTVDRLRSLAPPGYETVCADFAYCDLADLSSVVTFARSFTAKGLPLNVLFLNAGICPAVGQKGALLTMDGFEEAFQTNHLGHFLLTRLLTPLLKETPQSRIVVVSSSLHKGSSKGPPPLNLESVAALKEEWQQSSNGMELYKSSKLCNILFTHEANRRLQPFGVTANSLSPGFIPNTGLSRKQGLFGRFVTSYILPNLPLKFVATLDDAGTTTEFVSLSPTLDGVGGKYYSYCKAVDPSPQALDETLGARLWALSEEMVKGFHL